MPSPNSPATSLRAANHFPAAQMLIMSPKYMIYLLLWSTITAFSGLASSFSLLSGKRRTLIHENE
jgi:hypothetical protein